MRISDWSSDVCSSDLQTMINLGIEPRLAREIIAELPAGAAEDAERARFLPLGLLSRRIPVVSADPIHEGGIIALVGPTGVGKTTTIPKLAARYAAQSEDGREGHEGYIRFSYAWPP